jgi:hypothetical protein
MYKHFQHGTVQCTIVAGRSDRCVPRTPLRAEDSAACQHAERRMEVGHNTSKAVQALCIILRPSFEKNSSAALIQCCRFPTGTGIILKWSTR